MTPLSFAHFGMVSVVVQLTLAAIFLFSFSTKIKNVNAFAAGVGDYGILGRGLSRIYAKCIVGLELMLTVSHSTGWLLPVLALIGTLMLTTFLIGVVIVYRRGTSTPCHCFGNSEMVSSRSILRLALVLLAEVGLSAALWLSPTCPALIGRALSPAQFLFALPYASAALMAGAWAFSGPELVALVRELRVEGER
jgi:hypothetical protein